MDVSLKPHRIIWREFYDFHFKYVDVTADRCPDRGHTNSTNSTNFEFHCCYLSHIRRRDGVVASPSIRPSALKRKPPRRADRLSVAFLSVVREGSRPSTVLDEFTWPLQSPGALAKRAKSNEDDRLVFARSHRSCVCGEGAGGDCGKKIGRATFPAPPSRTTLIMARGR
jgi:hypothetical protein